MPRAKKPRAGQPPDAANPDAPETAAVPPPAEQAEGAEDSGAEARPSQLDQIRAAPAEDLAAEGPAAEPVDAATAGEAEKPAVDEPKVDQPAPATPPVAPWVPPPTHPPGPPAPPPPGPPGTGMRAFGSSSTNLAIGIVMVVVGIFFLVVRVTNIDLSTYGWPLYVIIPGLTLLVVGFVSLGTGAVIPGGIITMTGLVLAYQNSTGDWASWAYLWALVVPFGVGLGIFLQGLRDRDQKQLRQGRVLMFWGLMITVIGFVFFESILNISGIDYGILGRAALPVLLIIIGLSLLVRSVQRNRTERR
jgi:hypothetical protein